MSKVAVGRAEDIPVGHMKTIKPEGKSLVIYHLEDGFYATQSQCTHTFGPLGRGKIVEQCQIQCPLHRARFDVRTGEVIEWANFPPGIQLVNILRQEKALTTYTVTEEDGELYVEL